MDGCPEAGGKENGSASNGRKTYHLEDVYRGTPAQTLAAKSLVALGHKRHLLPVHMSTDQDSLTVCDACKSVLGPCDRRIPCGYCYRLEIACSKAELQATLSMRSLAQQRRLPLRIIQGMDSVSFDGRRRRGGIKRTVEDLAMTAFPSERIELGPDAVLPPGWLLDAVHRACMLEAVWKRLQKDQSVDWNAIKDQKAGTSPDSEFYLYDETALLALSILAEELTSTLLPSTSIKQDNSKYADLEAYLSNVLLRGQLSSSDSDTDESFTDVSSDSFGPVLSNSESSDGCEMVVANEEEQDDKDNVGVGDDDEVEAHAGKRLRTKPSSTSSSILS
jgi:hypothetical protein